MQIYLTLKVLNNEIFCIIFSRLYIQQTSHRSVLYMFTFSCQIKKKKERKETTLCNLVLLQDLYIFSSVITSGLLLIYSIRGETLYIYSFKVMIVDNKVACQTEMCL